MCAYGLCIDNVHLSVHPSLIGLAMCMKTCIMSLGLGITMDLCKLINAAVLK